MSALVKGNMHSHRPMVSHGEGVYLWDVDGKQYIDASSGAVAANLGHGDPGVLAAMREQAERVTFVHRGTFDNGPAESLAAELCEFTGYPYTYLCGSGSEGVELAMKFALQYWQEQGEAQRRWFLAHDLSYHGTTLGALSLSGHKTRRAVATNLLYTFDTLTAPYSYRRAGEQSEEQFSNRLLSEVAWRLDSHAEEIAAVVLEPVGGAAGGAIVPPAGYVEGLARLCRDHGVLLITDEVMTGLGRTGRVLAADHWGVRADIAVLGKGLGAGYAPMSAVMLTAPIVEAIASGTGVVTYGHTYAGNPMSAATALAVLREVRRRDLVSAAAARGHQLRRGLEELQTRHPVIGDVRGLGLLQAIELVVDRSRKARGTPVGSLAERLITTARRNNLLLYPATSGINDAVLVTPPLITEPEQIDRIVTLLDVSLGQMEDEARHVAPGGTPISSRMKIHAR